MTHMAEINYANDRRMFAMIRMLKTSADRCSWNCSFDMKNAMSTTYWMLI